MAAVVRVLAIRNMDYQLLMFLNGLAASPAFTWLIIFFGKYATYLAVAFMLLGIVFRSRLRKILIDALLAGLAARFIIVPIIRLFYHRPRPFIALHDVNKLIVDNDYSFPSGHASFFFAIAVVLFVYDKRLGVAFFILGTLISVSRVAAGVHYPSDIVGGLIVGSLVAWLALRAKKVLGCSTKFG